MSPFDASAEAEKKKPPPKITIKDYGDVRLILTYFGPWLVLPLIFFKTSPISMGPISSVIIASILTVAVSFFAFGKWYLLYKFGGGNGDKPPWKRILYTLLMILISFIVYCWLLETQKKVTITDEATQLAVTLFHKATLFDKATLWSAVYGTVLGALSFIKAD